MPKPVSRKPDLLPSPRLALARELDAEIRRLHGERNAARARIVARLAQMKASGGFRSLGFPCVQAYASDRLGWGKGKVDALLTLHDRLPHRPLLRRGFESGELDWTRAVLVGRACEKEPEREAWWLATARRTKNVRDLELLVAGRTGEEVRRGRWVAMTESQESVFEEGLRALRAEGLYLDTGAAVAELFLRALKGGAAGTSRARFLVRECPGCGVTGRPTKQGSAALDPATVERLRCDAEVQDTRVQPTRVRRAIPESVRNDVLARSEGFCEYFDCARDAEEIHHIEGRRRGHDPNTLLHLCSGHHHGPHEGAFRILGSWRTGVRFVAADGALLGTVGGPSARGDEPHSRECERWDEGPADLPARDFAILALRSLELRAGEAKALMARVFAQLPEAATLPPEELVRAALLLHAG